MKNISENIIMTLYYNNQYDSSSTLPYTIENLMRFIIQAEEWEQLNQKNVAKIIGENCFDSMSNGDIIKIFYYNNKIELEYKVKISNTKDNLFNYLEEKKRWEKLAPKNICLIEWV